MARRRGVSAWAVLAALVVLGATQSGAIRRISPKSGEAGEELVLSHHPHYDASESPHPQEGPKKLDFSILNSLMDGEDDEEPSDGASEMRFRERRSTMGATAVQSITEDAVAKTLERMGMGDAVEDEKPLYKYTRRPHVAGDRPLIKDMVAHHEERLRTRHGKTYGPGRKRKGAQSDLQPATAFVEVESSGERVVRKRHDRPAKATPRGHDGSSTPAALAETKASISADTDTHSDVMEHSKNVMRQKQKQRQRVRQLQKGKASAKAGVESKTDSDIYEAKLAERSQKPSPQPSHGNLYNTVHKHIQSMPVFRPGDSFRDMPRAHRTKASTYLKNARFAEVLRNMGTRRAGEGAAAGGAFEYKPSPFKHPPPPPVPPPPPPPPPPNFGPGSQFSGYQFGSGEAPNANAGNSFASLWEKTYPKGSAFAGKATDHQRHMPRFMEEDTKGASFLQEQQQQQQQQQQQRYIPTAHPAFVASRTPHPHDYLTDYAGYAQHYYPDELSAFAV